MRIKRHLVFMIVMISMIVISGNAFAKKRFDMMGSGKMVPYTEGKIVTKTGIIKDIEENSNNPIMGGKGLHLYVKFENHGWHTVHVCPQWYADKIKIKFNKGERITVIGSEFYAETGFAEGDNIYAATIKRDGTKDLNFRDEKTGARLWKGRYMNTEKQPSGKGKEMKSQIRQQNMQKNKQAMQQQMRQKMQQQNMQKMRQQMMQQNMPKGN